MADYIDRDVTGWDAERLVRYINQRLETNPSVQIFRRGSQVICRTWKIEFEVIDDAPEA